MVSFGINYPRQQTLVVRTNGRIRRDDVAACAVAVGCNSPVRAIPLRVHGRWGLPLRSVAHTSPAMHRQIDCPKSGQTPWCERVCCCQRAQQLAGGANKSFHTAALRRDPLDRVGCTCVPRSCCSTVHEKSTSPHLTDGSNHRLSPLWRMDAASQLFMDHSGAD